MSRWRMMFRSPVGAGIIGICLWAWVCGSASAGNIHGHARFEKIKGQPQMGYIELYESNLFFSPPDNSLIAPSRRLGTTCAYNGACVTQTTGDGCYCIDSLPAGTYSLLVNQPLFYIAPHVVSPIDILDTGMVEMNIDIPIDFSTFYKTDWTTSSESSWYQTFVATGVAVRGIAFSYAGPSPNSVSAALLEDNGNPDVRSWTVITQRTDYNVTDQGDNWVRFRSADAPTQVGHAYAVRLTANGGSIQPYKRNKTINSYAQGQAYNSAGVAQSFDLNVTVFTETDGTVVTMNKRTEGLGELLEGNFAWKWGQSFTATQTSLAAVDAWAAGANHEWDLDFRWRVYEGAGVAGPTGPQISPTKTSKAAYQSFGTGLHGISYLPNEVRLTPGQTYFVEFEIVSPPIGSQGFNPYIMLDDSYAGGTGYVWNGSGWTQRTSQDVSMTVLEYRPIGPLLNVDPSAVTRKVHRGGSPFDDVLLVTDVGNEPLTYSITTDVNWLSVTPDAGASGGESDAIAVHYTTSELLLGTHTGTITVTSPEAPNSPRTTVVQVTVTTVPPDFDHDEDVDLSDFGHLQACLTATGVTQIDPACADAKLDGDADVDADDLALFLACFSGPQTLAPPDCAPAE